MTVDCIVQTISEPSVELTEYFDVSREGSNEWGVTDISVVILVPLSSERVFFRIPRSTFEFVSWAYVYTREEVNLLVSRVAHRCWKLRIRDEIALRSTSDVVGEILLTESSREDIANQGQANPRLARGYYHPQGQADNGQEPRTGSRALAKGKHKA